MMKKLYFARIDINMHIENITATCERDEVLQWSEGRGLDRRGWSLIFKRKNNLNSIEQRVEVEQNNPLFGF